MAEETAAEQQSTTKGTNGGSGNGGHKTAVRAAAIAAATGATALAARKAFSGRDQGGSGRSSGGSAGDDSLVGAMLGSGWSAARDSLLPFAEDAAETAGEWVGRNGPEIVRDTLIPRFISGFQRGSQSAGDS